MAINTIAAYIYDEDLLLEKQGTLEWEGELGTSFTFSDLEADIQQGDIGVTRLVFAVPLATFSGGTPLVVYRRSDGYPSSMLTMNVATYTIDSVQYQVFYIDLTTVGWTYVAGRHAVQCGYMLGADYEALPLVFYTVADGVNNFEEVTADSYQEISSALHDQYANMLDQVSNLEGYAQNAFNYNGTIEAGVDYIQWLTTPRTEQGDLPIGARRYNDDFKTTELRLSSSVVIQDGQKIVIRVRNGESTDIVNGDVVYIYGEVGNSGKVLAKRASSTVHDQAISIIGVATETFSVEGFVTVAGRVSLDVSAYDLGTRLYLGTNGNMVTIDSLSKGANMYVCVGIVESNDRLLVDPRIHYNLDDSSNVETSGKTVNDLLIWNGTKYVNITKTSFLSALQAEVDTNKSNISTLQTDKEDKTNKITAWNTPTDVQYPSAKLVHDELKTLLKTATYNSTNGVMTFTKYDGSTITIDLPLELIIESGSYDAVDNDLVFILANGNEIRVPVDNLLTDLDAVNVRYDNTLSDLIATNVKAAIDELDTKHETLDDRVGTAESDIDTAQSDILALQNKDIEHEKDLIEHEQRIDSIEELNRKQDSDIASVDDDGIGIMHLGKDVAETTVTTKIEGLLLDSPNLVSSEAVANLGTRTFTTVNGVDYYVYDGITSSIITGDGNDYTLTNNTGASAIMHAYNTDTLKSNKQYSPLYSTTFDLMTDEQIKAQMDLWVETKTLPNSIMSVDMDKRVTSVGKNLFDKGSSKNISGFNITSTGALASNSPSTTTHKIEVKAGQIYTMSNVDGRYRFLDVDDNIIEVGFAGSNRVAPSGAKWIQYAFTTATFLNNTQLEVGTVATTYEPYRSSSMYLDSGEVGYSLPNGVKDTIEFRNGQAYYVQRVKKYTLQASDITLMYTTPVGIDYVVIQIPSGYVPTSVANTVYVQGMKGVSVTFDNVENIDKIVSYSSSLGQIAYGVIEGTTLEQARTLLVGKNIYYQLATPIETPISVIGNAIAYPNGTFYIEDVVRRSGVYSSGITVDKPIKTLDNIYKLNDDGSSTKLEVSGATIAGDGLSFTHTSLSNGDFVWFDYYYQGTNVKGLSTVYYYGDKLIGDDVSDGKTYKAVPVFTNGVVTWVSVEV